ncbi:hypothetical protein IQ231_19555 [Cuspidothrix issatschenkoi LEGE 03284]|uniref:hypothetical protein n=1 Tax=Cuspidothrix issatschenkoi TaxID=230752 RepID=UPI001880D5CB|nr:hypothetical protein [Cuspidothrix issatschenkoi]MBE9233805.1 hypothetical protein [Cuspidothrix issatschenkoi LEGE 03284]
MDCPFCKTELIDAEKQEKARNIMIVPNNFQEIQEEHIKFKDENTRLREENTKFKNELQKLEQKIQELELQLKKYEHPGDSPIKYNDLADNFEIQELIDKLKHPLVVEFIRNIVNEDYQQLNNYVNPDNQYDSTSHNTEENTTNDNLEDTIIHDNDLENNSQEHGYIDSSIGLTLDEQELVNNYKNPNSDFHQFIIKVSEPEESQTNRWSGSKEATIFKHNRQGNYWIVNKNDSSYIVPQKKFKINEYSQDTLFSTFDCRSYQSGKSENFVLIKPGKVTAINEDGWQLIEPGILQF